MAIQYIMHIGICVRDLDHSIRFYRDGLGFEEAGGLEVSGEPTATLVEIPRLELRAVYLDRGALRIELLHYPNLGTVGAAVRRPMNQPGFTHFAIRVDSLEETIATLVPLGATVLEHTRIRNEEFDAEIIYLTDPDGTRLECIELPNDPTRP
ncbi:MAG: VOC family protein [Deltaproteobacteria bacterium]|nr:VOC family protein [Deltaproteobacteria bacterium]MBW2362309.1 VOC family protein [Deltaproteobacteria bacterium]